MGAVCRCVHDEDFEEYVNPKSFVYRNYFCLRCFVQNCLNVYTALFRIREVHATPLSVQGAASLTSTASHDSTLSDINSSPPRLLPYDADPRCFLFPREGLVSRREKGSSQSHEESEPLRRGDIDVPLESLTVVLTWNGSDGIVLKEPPSETSVKHSSTKVASGVGYLYLSPEDDDVCPTCLKEYTLQNPKIMTGCSHHFHLGCIYEWMERSETCPVGGKILAMLTNDEKYVCDAQEMALGARQIFKKMDVGALEIGDYLAIGAIFSATDFVCTLQVLN